MANKHKLSFTAAEVEERLRMAGEAVLFTEQNLTEKQQEQARANIGTIPKSKTFNVNRVASPGKNLLDVNAQMPDPSDVYSGGFLIGKIFNDDGDISDNSAACITDYIPIIPGWIVCSCSADGKRKNMSVRRVMGYDKNKTLIGLVASSNVRFEIPEDVPYIRLQFASNLVDSQPQVEIGENLTEYEPYSATYFEEYTLKSECMPETNGSFVASALLPTHKARFDDSFNYIAYSIVEGSAGSINTAEHFKWAAKHGFTALKGDVRPTSDGGLIMCHDAGFTLADGKITAYNTSNNTAIRDMTEAQCLNLQHANTLNHVCNFETYIRICKMYGKIAFITIRDEYIEDIVPAMFDILDKYSMRKRCIVNSFTIASLQAVRNVDGNIMLSHVLYSGTVPTISHIEAVKALGNCLLSTFTFPSHGGFAPLEQGAEALAYARSKDIRVYAAQTDKTNDVDTLLQYGITGTQMLVAPNFD